MNRRLTILPALLVALGCSQPQSDDAVAMTTTASPYEANDADRAEIVHAVQLLFDALESGDADLLRSVVDPSVVMHYSEVAADGTSSFGSSTLEQLATRIESSGAALIERMWDQEVRIDGALATVWTPYDFYAGSEFSHCGVDAVTLMKRDAAWEIVGLSWTRHQPPACPLNPAGPPDA